MENNDEDVREILTEMLNHIKSEPLNTRLNMANSMLITFCNDGHEYMAFLMKNFTEFFASEPNANTVSNFDKVCGRMRSSLLKIIKEQEDES